MVGALLITLAAVGAYVLSGQNEIDNRIAYLVASSDLAPGQMLRAEDISTSLVELPPGLADSSFTDATAVVGAVALGPIGEGELLQTTAMTPPQLSLDREQPIEFSFALPNQGAPRSLRPGEHVAMLSTTGRNSDAVTTVVVGDAVVTDVVHDDESFASSGDMIITLAIADSTEVLAAANAAQATDVTILRLPADGSVVLPPSSALQPSAVPTDAIADPLAAPSMGDPAVDE